MNIRYNKDPHNRYDCWEYGSFTLKKEMVFSSVKKLDKVVNNLNKLKNEKFYNVIIPDFTIEVNDHILQVEMEYVKGDYMQSIHHYNIV